MSTHYTVGRNIAGYLPESDVTCWTTWQDAATFLAGEMREYAERDDEAAWEWLDTTAQPEDYPRQEDGTPDYGDDAPSMGATVAAILADDGPRDAGQPWGALVEDNDGRMISFWLAVVPAEDCQDDHDDED